MSAKHTPWNLSTFQSEALRWLLQYGPSKDWDWGRFLHPASVHALKRRGLAQWVTLASGERAIGLTHEGRAAAMRMPKRRNVVDDFGNLIEVSA